MVGYIYALKDRGFDRGIKIGRDSNFPTRFQRAQCYSPRGIDLVAAWRIDADKKRLANMETQARTGLPQLYRSNAGVEWRDLTAEEAIQRISGNIGHAPEVVHDNPPVTTTYDDFRDPKRLGREKHRQALWLYRENETGILKAQRTSSWKVPLEPVKTYSLLGFKPVAAFLHPTSDMRGGNRKIQSLWEQVVRDLGHGTDHLHVGWLRDDIGLDRVRDLILTTGLVEVPGRDWGTVPPGLKATY